MGENHRECPALLLAGKQVITHGQNEDRQQKDHHERDVETARHQVDRVLQFEMLGHVERRRQRDRQIIQLNSLLHILLIRSKIRKW